MVDFDRGDIQRRLQRIEELVRTLEALEASTDSSVRSSALELMRSLMELHGAGIERMMEIAFDSGAHGGEIIDRLAGDELVAKLLLLYDLHPHGLETRASRALEGVRPHLKSHGGNVELLGVADGVIRLRLQGNCNGCPSSAETLRQLIEQAIYEAAPDARAIEVESVVDGAGKQAVDGLVQLRGGLPKNS
jgi:Fe-S cluster biogenesis protein NfuA